jgi:hypothetical protein
LGDVAWRVLRDRASLNLLKGNIEGGNWAIAHGEFSRFFSRENLKVVIGRLAWLVLSKRASINLLKGNYEGRNQGNCTSPVLLKGKSEGGKKGDLA